MAETAEVILTRMWRFLRDNCAENQKARFYGAATALQQIGAINLDQLELWIRRIETCPGHDDEGGRSWCAYCGTGNWDL